MRCSRSGMMLFGPNTIENAAIVAGEAALAVLAQQDLLAQDLVAPVRVLTLAGVDGSPR
jgi:hypothetical protein